MARQWNPDPHDIAAICEDILTNTVEAFNDRDECRFCGREYGNASHFMRTHGRLLHHNDCIVLKAQDVMTGIDAALSAAPPQGGE